MFRKAGRLPYFAFQGRPTRRARFRFGTVAFFNAPPGVAVVVSKKVARLAVDRNRIRRRVSHALKGTGLLDQGVVVYPTIDALRAPFSELKDALEQVTHSR